MEFKTIQGDTLTLVVQMDRADDRRWTARQVGGLVLAVCRVLEHAKEADIAGAEDLNSDIGQITVMTAEEAARRG